MRIVIKKIWKVIIEIAGTNKGIAKIEIIIRDNGEILNEN